MECTERACAKVNLTLCVGGKRPDGYHTVTSVMQRIGLWDTVTVRGSTGEDALHCDVPVTERAEDNLCMKALRVFFAETGARSGGVTITLKKRIPTQAGLGGGSSDAAAVLRGLRRLYAPDMTDAQLEGMAAQLGSDVPFFIRGGTQLATGRGEVAANNVHAVAAELHNSFERVVPEGSSLWAIKDALRAQGALGTLLSGSGSAVFGLFDDRNAAIAAAEFLRRTWPQVFVAKPV